MGSRAARSGTRRICMGMGRMRSLLVSAACCGGGEGVDGRAGSVLREGDNRNRVFLVTKVRSYLSLPCL